MSRTIRIGGGQGFWGDWLEAPVRLVQGGPLDYLVLDYVAEVTMSIMQKQRARDISQGYARDFVTLMERLLPDLVAKRIRVVSNAGGVNPRACAAAVLDAARKLGLAGKVKIGLVTGDDIMHRLDDLMARGQTFQNLDTGKALSTVRPDVQAASAYLGMAPVVKALDQGADIVISGRLADPVLALGPIFHEFKWSADDVDKVAAGIVAGHVIECGAQSSGGNLMADWRKVRDLANVGFPIVEVADNGSFVVTKHPGTGGVVNLASVTEQLVYEIGDPKRYVNADGVADFTSIQLTQRGRDRVQVSGIRGAPKTPFYKVSIAYHYGYKAVGTLVYSWPDAYDKARVADRIIRERLGDQGLHFEKIHTEFVGYNATHGRLAGPPDPELPEVQLRIGVRARDREPVERFAREVAPLVLTGPPGVTGYGSKPDVKEIVAFWPALIPREEIDPGVRVELLSG
ncbi:MAG TPA: acyclic terpene utilization AtuA family protein [Gemmatimonadales bacterium]|nr:acyclic terpene utilization AtuA family protein [Gemmatimonadales bacterium]